MRNYRSHKLSSEEGLNQQIFRSIDDLLSKDFTLVKTEELSIIGIERILFMGKIQVSAFYYVAPDDREGLRICLMNQEKQETWLYQSLAQWAIVGALSLDKVMIFSLAELKVRLKDFRKMHEESKFNLLIPWNHLELSTLKTYDWTCEHLLKKRYGELNWRYPLDTPPG